MSLTVSKRRKFIQQGCFFAESNEFLKRELATEGFTGVEVRVTPQRTEIIIAATKPPGVLGDKGIRIRELTSVIQKRFNLEKGVEVYADKVPNKGLSAAAQAESLKFKLIEGLVVRRACYGVLRYVMDSGAKGCEVTVSGKLRAQRAKSMIFRDGYMIKTGNPVKDYIDTAIRHVYMKQGILGVKVQIMLPWDASGKIGPKKPLPDLVRVLEPKEDLNAPAQVAPVTQTTTTTTTAAAQE